MIRTQVQFREAQLRGIRAAARLAGVSVAEFVRGAVDRALSDAQPGREQAWQRLLASAGAFHDREGHDDLAENHDAALAAAFSP